MIKIVRGNDFTLKIPVEVQTGVDPSGNPIISDFDFTGANVSVNIINRYSRIPFVHTVERNVITVPVSAIGNGTYDVEILVSKEGNMRSMKRAQFKIVESNEESDLSSPVEFDVEIHQLDAHVLVGNSSGSGTTDYNQLGNRPKINNVTLAGNKTLEDLGIQPTSTIPTKVSELSNDSKFVTQEYVDNQINTLNALIGDFSDVN